MLKPISPGVALEGGRARTRRGPRSRLLRATRIVGLVMAVIGIGGAAWTLVVWQWQDPFTALYTTYEQHKLSERYGDRFDSYTPRHAVRGLAAERREIALEARRYRRSLKPGDPVGRLHVPRLGLNRIVVNGTDSDDLRKGPGRYIGSFLPGELQLIYVAGHRTTFGAPFAHIERLRPGDRVTFELPYGTFVYAVRSHKIVPADDVAELRSHGREVLALQACHPRFFATHRYIAYAVPVRVIPRVGRPYSVPNGRRAVRAG